MCRVSRVMQMRMEIGAAKAPAAVSLFAGCGGDTLGLAEAGFTVPSFVENWRPAVESHLANFPDSELLGQSVAGDIRKVPDEAFSRLRGKVDLVFAGFPCQGFSHAGKKDPNDPRNRLFWEFVRATAEIRPRWVVGENVSGLLHRVTDDGTTPVGDVIVDAFESIGYRMAKPFILDAADYTVPQRRRRVFFVGNRMGLPFRPPSPESKRSRAAIRPHVRFSLAHAIPLNEETVAGGIRTWVEGDGEPSGAAHPYLIQKANSHLMSYAKRDSPFHVEVVDLDAPAKTIHSGYEFQPRLFPAMRTSRGFFARAFTPAELSSIQGFPASFYLAGKPKDQVVQIGNAVPPGLARAVALQIVRCDSELASPQDRRSGQLGLEASAPTP